MKRANTKEQKEEIIKILLDLWIKNPELRLSQIIFNCFKGSYSAEASKDRSDIFHIEDYNFIEYIKRSLEEE